MITDYVINTKYSTSFIWNAHKMERLYIPPKSFHLHRVHCITDAISHLIVDKVKKGESKHKVALQINMGVSTGNQIVKRYRLTGSIDNHHRSGH